MFKTTAVIGLATAVISFVAVPVYADGVFSTSNLRIGDVNLSISSNGRVLAKADANTGQQRGRQNFREFYGMMWEPSNSVLFVAGILEGSNQPVLVKIRSTGGGGNNMFALTSDGGSVPRYNYRLGSQLMKVRRMSYNGNLQIENGSGVLYQIRGVGGTGNNMFALANNSACQTAPGYNYFISCSSKANILPPQTSSEIRGKKEPTSMGGGWAEASATFYRNGLLIVEGHSRSDSRTSGTYAQIFVVGVDSRGRSLFVSNLFDMPTACSLLDTCSSERRTNFQQRINSDLAQYIARVDVYVADRSGGRSAREAFRVTITESCAAYDDLPLAARAAIAAETGFVGCNPL